MSDIRIAPTTQGQLEAVLDQTRATFQTHRARFPKSFPNTILYKLEEIHRDAVDLADGAPTSFCAEWRGENAGFVLLRPKKRACAIYDIGVFHPFRRQGVARALVRLAVSAARSEMASAHGFRLGWQRGFPPAFSVSGLPTTKLAV